MEELSVYRNRIGIFAYIANKKSSGGKKPKHRSDKSKSSTKSCKRIKKKTASVTKALEKQLDYERRPTCRLALLILVIVIGVICSRNRHETNLFPISFNENSSMSIDISGVQNIKEVTVRTSNNSHDILHYKEDVLRHTDLYDVSTNISDMFYYLFGPCRPPERLYTNKSTYLEKKNMSFKERSWITLEQVVVFAMYANAPFEEVNNISTFNRTSDISCDQGSQFPHGILMTNHPTLLILMCIIMLCCLGTCCYLLGNKGTHCYNGNPKHNLAGDATLSQETLDMITEYVHESVGYIQVTHTLPGTHLKGGTGFRAGNVYFITTYHVLKDKVGMILDEICHMMDSKDKTAILETLTGKLDITVTEQSDPTTAIRKVLEEFVNRNSTNIPMLIHLLDDTLKEENLENHLFQQWTKTCKVNFIKEGQFLVDWKIVFGDEQSDVMIVKLIKTSNEQQYPKPLLLDADYLPQSGTHVIRYNIDGIPYITIDQDTKVYEDDTALQKDVESAIKYWTQTFPEEHDNYFRDLYSSCSRSYNKGTGRVVLKASKSFKHEASGSPIVYKYTSDGQPIVGMVYQKGLPEFYYEAQRQGSQFNRFRNVEIDPEICLFEGGMSIKHIANLLDKQLRTDVKRDIFPQSSETTVTHCIGKQDLIRIQEKLHKGEFKSLKRKIIEIDPNDGKKLKSECRGIKRKGETEAMVTRLPKMRGLGDDAKIYKETLPLLKEDVDESVGYIRNTSLGTSATGFRAGDEYFITAYHVFKEEIDNIVDKICFEIQPSENLQKDHEDLARKLNIKDYNTENEPLKMIRSILKRFLHENSTDIYSLLECLRDLIDTGKLAESLSKQWTKSSEVNFIKQGKFVVDWKVAFGDAANDIIIVKLIKTKHGQTYPRALLLDENYRQTKDIYIIRYIMDDRPNITVDQNTLAFGSDGDLKNSVETAVEWWQERFTNEDTNYFRNLYNSCRLAHDEQTGRVVLKASQTFKHGASGSPIVYLFNKEGQPVVSMIYQRGLPEFYYLAQKGCKSYERFKDVDVDSDKCLFEGGTTMKKLAELLHKNGYIELKRNLFAQPKTNANHHKRTEERQDQKPECESAELGLSKLHELATSGSSVNSEKLSNMIRQAEETIKDKTHWTYIKTKAFERSMEILQSSNTIFITGNPGDGKTALAFHILKEITERCRQRKPLIICEPEQFDELVAAKSSLCVLIDNIFGSFVLETSKTSSWNDRFGIMCSVFKAEKDTQNNILILTSRKDIYKECSTLISIDSSPLFDEQSIVDLTSKDSMTRGDMRAIFDVYFADGKGISKLTDQEIQVIECNSPNIGFPQCCKMARSNAFSSSNRTTYFINPKEYLSEEIKKLCNNRKGIHKYCSLLVLLFSPTFVNLDEQEHITKDLLTFLEKEYAYSCNGKHYLKQTLLTMDGLYVQHDIKTGNISFSHESIQTAVALLFGSTHTKHFIQFCESRLLSYLALDDKLLSKKDYIIVPQSEWQHVMIKIKEQLLTQEEQRFKYIADMQVWENPSFLERFIHMQNNETLSIFHLDKCGISMLVYFASRNRNVPVKKIIDMTEETKCERMDEQFRLAVNSACAIGNEEIAKLLLGKSPQPDIHHFINAVKGRKVNIVSKLIDIFPNVIKDTKVTARLIPHEKISSITVLHQACFEGNLEIVNVICLKCPNLPLIRDSYGRTVLHISCYEGHVDVCDYLITNYPDLLKISYDGILPIHLASQSGNTRCFNLLEKTVNTEDLEQFITTTVTDMGYNVLHAACLGGGEEMVKYIINKYPYLLQLHKTLKETEEHLTHLAAFSGNIDLLKYIIKELNKHTTEGVSIDIITSADNNGSTMLHAACRNGKAELCQYIVETYPALINVRRNNGWHILHEAAWSGSIECLKLITDIVIKDSDPDHRQQFMLQCLGNDGSTILHSACGNGKTGLCQYIVETYPALINVRRNNGWHILHEAAWSGSIECLKLITDRVIKDSDPDHRQQFMLQCLDNVGSTILHAACRNGKTGLCQYIVETFPALANSRRYDGWHILHDTAWSGSIECLKLITDIVIKDSDPDYRQQFMLQCLDNVGSTILHAACRNGKTGLCQYIVETFPALANSRRYDGWHILHDTAWSGSIECLKLITDIVIKDSDPDYRQQFMLQCLDNVGSTILHAACGNGKTGLCQYIVETYPALANIRRYDGHHILHQTAESGSIECLKLITDIVIKDSDPDHRQQFMLQCLDDDGSTILHLACRNTENAICQYIGETYPALVNVRANDGEHILHETAWSGSIDCLKLITDLVIKDSDPDHRQQFMLQILDNIGSTILHTACRNGKTRLCQYIVETYPDLINVKRFDGQHILHETSFSGSIDCLKLITDIVIKDNDPDRRQQFMLQCLDNDGSTILHAACRNGKTGLCQYIVETYPALVNVRGNDGEHILHETARSGSIECLKQITDIVIKDTDPDHRQQFMLQCLDNVGSTILHSACRNGKTGLCQYIVEAYPALVNVRRNDEWHILHETAWSGSIECLKLITDIVLKDNNKERREKFMMKCVTKLDSNILQIARMYGRTKMCEYIAKIYPALRSDNIKI